MKNNWKAMKIKNKVLIFCCLVSSFPVMAQAIQVKETLLENRTNPTGIDVLHPQFTWILEASNRNVTQSAYQIQVSENKANFDKNLLWDSKKIKSSQSVRVLYEGPDLASAKKYYWRVKVWNQDNKDSKYSDVGMWQMGLLKPADWKAKWIEAEYVEDSVHRASPMFRNDFKIDKKIESATAIITSHGLYQAFLNGKKIGDAYLTPGWTSYNKRLQYQMYDVTKLLQQGENAVGALLGSGWYRGPLAWGDNLNIYGKNLALLMQIEVQYTDGTSAIFGTDENWKSTSSDILSSQIYNGEVIDSRKEKEGWKRPNYSTENWSSVNVKDFDNSNLVATYNEPIRKHETFKPLNVITTPEGDKVIDFGQNLVGFVMVTATGKAGDSITLDHAEVLDKAGNFYTDNLRAARQENTYILSGKGEEIFEPNFTWQGFRFVRVKGIKGEINPDDFTAVALYSDMQQTGTFTTSNKLLNQLQHNIQWGQRGNFLDVPTDCPQRDERLGWTGDAQVFSKTAAYNMHVDNFFTKWMKDVSADQFDNGSIPHVIPNVLGNAGGSAGWGDVSTIIPWNMYLLYGNTDILKNQYQSMKGWVDYMNGASVNNLWNTGSHFGDWLFYAPEDDNDGRAAITDKYLIAQCFFAHSTQLLINTAQVLDKQEDVEKYSALLEKIKKAFLNEYTTPNGRLVSGSQTAYVLALNFDMLPENLREQAAKRLAENIQSYNYHLTTGFLGTPYLGQVLTRFGYHDLAYTLLMQKTYPSWLYPVTAGATTIWERWDGRKPDGTFETPTMNSFNHYAYGAIGDWMYSELAGINSSEKEGEVGYKNIIIKPHLKNNFVSDEVRKQNNDDALTEVEGSLITYYGTVKSHWKVEGKQTFIDIQIPVNTTATVYLPESDKSKIQESNKELSSHKEINIADQDENNTVLSLGSGDYHFVIN
ncbi:MAG: family 78 glycoside hydrolase catalytic domain [Leeuwenhoekiella sp.]